MSEEGQGLEIRRILVALDASPHSLAALEAAIELAGRFHAELAGIFVEDADLLRSTQLPFSREVSVFSATRRELDTRELERQFRARSRRIERLLAGATQAAKIRWTYRVVRGAVPSEVMSAASEADVVILGRAGWSLVRRQDMGSTARAIVGRTSGLALILHEGTCLEAPLLVAYDGSYLSRRALEVARRLLRSREETLIVLLLAERGQVQELREQVLDLLGRNEVRVSFRVLKELTPSGLAQMVYGGPCGLLVLPAYSRALRRGTLGELLDRLAVPVLLVGE